MSVLSSNSIVTIWFIFEHIYYRFVTFERLDCLLTPPRQRGVWRRRNGLSTLEADAFHPLKINIENTSLCLFLSQKISFGPLKTLYPNRIISASWGCEILRQKPRKCEVGPQIEHRCKWRSRTAIEWYCSWNFIYITNNTRIQSKTKSLPPPGFT